MVTCAVVISVPRNSYTFYGNLIPQGGSAEIQFELPETYSGPADAAVICFDDNSGLFDDGPGAWWARWDLGPVTVGIAVWSATMGGTTTPGQVVVTGTMSLASTCTLKWDLPTNGWSGWSDQHSWDTSSHWDGELGAFSVLWPGTAKFTLVCVDDLGRSHTVSESIEVTPDPSNIMPPYRPPTAAPTATPRPTPMPSETPAPADS